MSVDVLSCFVHELQSWGQFFSIITSKFSSFAAWAWKKPHCASSFRSKISGANYQNGDILCFAPSCFKPWQKWRKRRENLLMDLLQEGDLLLQCLDASLQVQTGQRGGVHVLPQVRWVIHRDRKWNSGGEMEKKNNNSKTCSHSPPWTQQGCSQHPLFGVSLPGACKR